VEGQGRYSPKKLEVKVVHGNLSPEVVSITVDRLSLILHKHGQCLGKSRDWLAPAGLLLTIVLTFVTTEFRDWLLPKDSWRAIFFLIGLASFVWLGKTIHTVITAERIEDLVERLKKQS